jgi:hypothetical protein
MELFVVQKRKRSYCFSKVYIRRQMSWMRCGPQFVLHVFLTLAETEQCMLHCYDHITQELKSGTFSSHSRPYRISHLLLFSPWRQVHRRSSTRCPFLALHKLRLSEQLHEPCELLMKVLRRLKILRRVQYQEPTFFAYFTTVFSASVWAKMSRMVYWKQFIMIGNCSDVRLVGMSRNIQRPHFFTFLPKIRKSSAM